MRRPILVCALFLLAAAALAAQTGQSSQSNPYSGTSNPPPDSTIIDNTPPQPVPVPSKPSPMQTMGQAMAKPAVQQAAPMPPPAAYPNNPADGTDDGIVHVAPGSAYQPELNERAEVTDPDGDIVHPAPLPPGELGPGTEIRARLLDRLSTAYNRSGDTFRCRVASDVFRGNEILIPAGAEIDGSVVDVSTGHFGGHGSMLLRPETVILPDGSRYRLYAQTTGAPDSNARVGGEGTISPGSHLKKDSIEYGGAAGAGAIAGGVLGGPAGALAGTLVGAGAVTVHLLVNHPQATLEPGAVLDFSLTEPLDLAVAAPPAQGAPANAQPDQVQPTADAQPPGDAGSGTVTQN
ncbi:MAG TPA: hypothetical protein VMD55_03740 [Terracidiphilus sp.]|nr:hypothetical protein [Terracidiphilus sp.]